MTLAFSVVVTPRHFCANACGVSNGSVVKLPYPAVLLDVAERADLESWNVTTPT